ncbi:MAG: hypothetical protein CL484_00665 [Acidobacteria bacterium]|nr:hypothetical protein [Acidobacteriota bacterium]|tara:strand:+ start:783 stop:1589 length:807 start_codon:yes stop_codon:yes gene_type:complete
MTLSFVLFLFLAHLGLGIVFSLLLVDKTAGVKFFRFNAGFAAVLLLAAMAMRPDVVALGSERHGLALLLLVVATGAILIYWVTIGRVLAWLRPLWLWLAVCSGALALISQAVAAAPSDGLLVIALTIASFVSSVALLGGTSTAMILGHWYLVLPSMDVSLLQAIVRFHIGSTALRILVVGLAVWWAIEVIEIPGGSFNGYIFSIDGVFFWQRVLFGLLGPVVLAYMTWETAKIQSTQSATGILYVDFFTVIVGEVLAKYLLVATTVPL